MNPPSGTPEPVCSPESVAWIEAREGVAPVPSGRVAGWFAGGGGRRLGRNGAVGLPAPRAVPAAAPLPPVAAADAAGGGEALQHRVDQLVRNWRVRGHIAAAVDPLGRARPRPPELEPPFWGIAPADFDRAVSRETIAGDGPFTVRGVIERLADTYGRSIGAQFMHIDDLAVRRWLQDRMEASRNRLVLGRNEQLRILTRLTDAVIFEEFVQKKFVGAKSFSLEGAESLVPLLDLALEKAGQQGVDEVVIGMAHRGRLNVLANILGKSPRQIFREFADLDAEQNLGSGDVKYHLGHSSTWTTAAGRKLHLSLCFNPSHLELVNPVAQGRMRAKMDRVGDARREKGLVVLIHGDAAFAGEGIVQETLNLSELPSHAVGGTLHVVVNNQIGFTTPPEESRSSTYATDVAKLLQSPILHVNGEDPEAVAQAVKLALEFRAQFRRDVVLDMWCYRRRGHNEGDEPSFTQPLLYRAIEQRKSVRHGYLDHLLEHGGVTRDEAETIVSERKALLERELAVAKSGDYTPKLDLPGGLWDGCVGGLDAATPDVDSGVPRERLAELLVRLATPPAGFTPHPKVARLLEQRLAMARGELPLDWAAAEALAFATLAADGARVRLTGQDSERGTFSHRHAVLHDVRDGTRVMPLAAATAGQAPIEIWNSALSETAVLGFEYGYSLDAPDALVLWEAQFGDFVNVAQPIVDQFLASAEAKWRRLSGLVLLLPHGYEGAGPEHSSARPERFLELFAQDNLQLAQPTTPAQYFHLLRRQVVRRWRKPLIVLTPKSLLRSSACTSTLEELAGGRFLRVLADPAAAGGGSSGVTTIRRILLCSGRVFFDLMREREARGAKEVAIVRLEQAAPLADAELLAALAASSDAPSVGRAPAPVLFVQDEPENMGLWPWLRRRFGDRLPDGRAFSCVTRPASASPATGSHAAHKFEQRRLLEAAFAQP
ncbi:MAG: 2-oxoglutarate dehydrogenase E1 component [Planctomycetes bacterium]|nr:2-oxoglutarate dehydrogenase E1 component [Planctomycetota bacterium]